MNFDPKYRFKFTFFDEYWTDFRKNTIRRWFEPKLFSFGPHGPYVSMVYNRERAVYQQFYEYVPDVSKSGVRQLKMSESKDLVNWTPVLNEEGSDVLYTGGTGIHGCSVMLDEAETDPAKRYKLCGMLHMGDREDGKHTNTQVVTMSYSPDGIHWTADEQNPVHNQTSDTINKLFYNPVTREYCVLMRSAFVDRRISMKRSKDLIHWTEPELIIHPSPAYNDGITQMMFYGMTAKYADGIFYAPMWRYNTCLYDMEYTKLFGYMEPELYYSYDGLRFMPTNGKAMMPRPEAPTPGCVGLSPNDILESADGTEEIILCTGNVICHGSDENTLKYSKIFESKNIKRGTPIYKIRKDGFCGIESVCHGGELVTKPIALKSGEVTLNVNAACGFVRYGIRKRNGEFMEGFSYDDCVPVEFTDTVDFKMQFNERKLEEISDEQCRISIELNSAIIYSITVDAVPFIRQRQESFTDPHGVM